VARSRAHRPYVSSREEHEAAVRKLRELFPLTDEEPTCVNLKEAFPRYRIFWEADGVTKRDWRRDEWPWLMEIRCKWGLVHPHGEDILTAVVPHSKIAGRMLRSGIKFLRVMGAPVYPTDTWGDEPRFWFRMDQAEAVFAFLKPKLKRPGNAGSRNLAEWRLKKAQAKSEGGISHA